MNILDAIVNAQDGAAVQQLGSQVGLAPDQTTAALSALMPALAGGFQRNIQSQGGLESLMAALSSGNHGQYIDNPTSLADPSAVTDGNGILGHLLGSKDASREVASRAAAQTGLSADVPETHAAARRHVDDGRILEAVRQRVLHDRGTRWLRRRHRGDADAFS
jgi:hypothetical protein